MGAWGTRPMENDTALDWVNARVERPVAKAIGRTLRAFTESSKPNDVLKLEAEAAASLLAALTSGKDLADQGIDLRELADQSELWSLAEAVLSRLSADHNWLAGWNEPDRKRDVLLKLAQDLKGNQSRH